jgi:phospholipase C
MPIQHFFVLMLENRSFDHIFGFSPFSGPLNNTNTDTATGKPYQVQPTADFSLKGLDVDPGHEFGDVQQQLAGGNGGFVNNYAAQKGVVDPGRVMNCFSPAQLPVLNQWRLSLQSVTAGSPLCPAPHGPIDFL